ncbi:MAG: ABC transporter ATP-binding protein [Polyangiaceae bacterium]|nr:ABC transporter ATP-binding protein [Polyangiaceae bacterium]
MSDDAQDSRRFETPLPPAMEPDLYESDDGDRHTPPAVPRSKRVGSPILRVEGLRKIFEVGGGWKTQSLRALNEISFDLYPGEVIALVGESGSGKSTILKILSRLEQPTAGSIHFSGKDILAKEPQTASLGYRGQVQMIYQDPFGSLNPVHNIAYHLKRPLLRHGQVKGEGPELDQKVLELLETVGLTPAAEFARKKPHEMSGGQRQRVAIARALAVDPALILADEPISMLDVSIRMGILNLMDDLKTKHGIAYLYVTHDIASARYIADRTMVMYAGHMVEGGSSETLLDHPAHPYTKLLLEAVPDPKGNIFRALSAKSGSPQLVDPGPGCPFANRCPEVMDVCHESNPAPVPLRRRGDGFERFVRCHLYSDSAKNTSDSLKNQPECS